MYHIGKSWFINNIEAVLNWKGSREELVENISVAQNLKPNGVRIRLSNIKRILDQGLLKESLMIISSSRKFINSEPGMKEKVDYLLNKLC